MKPARIEQHVRDCICRPFWRDSLGHHSPACEMKHAADFRALVADTRARFTEENG